MDESMKSAKHNNKKCVNINMALDIGAFFGRQTEPTRYRIDRVSPSHEEDRHGIVGRRPVLARRCGALPLRPSSNSLHLCCISLGAAWDQFLGGSLCCGLYNDACSRLLRDRDVKRILSLKS